MNAPDRRTAPVHPDEQRPGRAGPGPWGLATGAGNRTIANAITVARQAAAPTSPTAPAAEPQVGGRPLAEVEADVVGIVHRYARLARQMADNTSESWAAEDRAYRDETIGDHAL